MRTVIQELNSTSGYRALHPALFTYNAHFVQRFIDPSMHHNDEKTAVELRVTVQEIAEQIYQFQLFTADFCQCLIEEAEQVGGWETNWEKSAEPHPFFPEEESIVDLCEPDTTISLDEIPGMTAVYAQVIDRHLRPLVETLWRTFHLQKWDLPEVRKYEPTVINGMDLHYDLETVAFVTYLGGATFVGGGTYFPRWQLTVGDHLTVRQGSAIVYPGGVSHEHAALPVTAGVRYMLGGSLY